MDVYRDYSHYQIRFESIEDKKTGKIISGRPVAPLAKVGNTRKRGTQVCFKPDPRVFEDTRFNGDNRGAAVCANWPISTRACALCSSTSAKTTKSAAAANTAMRAVWRFRALFEHGQEYRNRTDYLRGTQGRHAAARGHPVYGFLHRKYLFLCQQRAHRRGRHARNRLQSGRHQGV